MTIDDIKSSGLLLFECISGSKAYGLDTRTSDTDIKGVFYLSREQFYGLQYTPQISNDTNDIVYYEIGRFVELLTKSNPGILELLATPADCILYKHPLMEELTIGMCLSKLCKETFAGYAQTQIQKAKGLNKKIVNPAEAKRRSVTDFCFVLQGAQSVSLQHWLMANHYVQEHCGLSAIPHTRGMFAVFYDAKNILGYNGIVRDSTANEVCLSAIPKDVMPVGYLHFNADAYSAYCKEYRQYWDWVKRRNEQRYADNSAHGHDYDAKNMMHTFRLLQQAEEILRTGKLTIRRPNREELLAIKYGSHSHAALLQKAGEWMQKVELAFAGSALPEEPAKVLLEHTLVKIRTALYQ